MTEQFIRAGFVKVRFALEVDQDGWPPVGSESVWALPTAEGYEISNTPWFTSEASYGDVVAAETDDEGVLRFEGIVRESGRSTLRVIVSDHDADMGWLLDSARTLGCDAEVNQIHRIIAVDVPADGRFRSLIDFLDAGEASGRLGWETGRLSSAHVPEFEQWRREGGSSEPGESV